MSSSPAHPHYPSTGRVVRFHLQCRAELPIGSTLRVTGRTLWSPSANPGVQHRYTDDATSASATEPAIPTPASGRATPGGNAGTGTAGTAGVGGGGKGFFSTASTNNFAANNDDYVGGDNDTEDNHMLLYGTGVSGSSSIELVTTPETYPIWKTKRPVVIVLHKTKSQQIQHHYYRYFIVTPGSVLDHPDNTHLYGTTPSSSSSSGGLGSTGEDDATMGTEEDEAAANIGFEDEDDDDTSKTLTPLIEWENPFTATTANGNGTLGGGVHSAKSTQSMLTAPSVFPPGADPALGGTGMAEGGTGGTTLTLKQLANLPYRTLDIHVGTAKVLGDDEDEDDDGNKVNKVNDGEKNNDDTMIHFMDEWNNKDDATYRAYQIRESVEQSEQTKAAATAAAAATTATTTTKKILSKQISDVTDDLSLDYEIQMDVSDAAVGDREVSGTSGLSGSTSATPTPTRSPNQQDIFFICFHLPVVVVKTRTNEWRASWSESLLAKKIESKITSTHRAHWVGTVTTSPPIQSQQDMNDVRKLLKDMDCTPIFIPSHIQQAHYYGFCKQVLWPAFHNIDLLDLSTTNTSSTSGGGGTPTEVTDVATPLVDPTTTTATKASSSSSSSTWDQSRLDFWWTSYQRVNQEFATVVQNLVVDPDNTYLWIHDYHLSLLPRYLQEQQQLGQGQQSSNSDNMVTDLDETTASSSMMPPPSAASASTTPTGGKALKCKTVFFLHIPFPTSQIFRELECGQSILEGMLHADVVGFHAFDHARHFLNAAKRILGLNYESLVGGLIGVNFQGKTVLVSMNNVSIEPKMVDAALALPSVDSGRQALKDKHGDRMVIAGADIGQRLSGTSLKLLAYERLLHDYPSWQTKVVMVQKVLLPGSRKADEAVTVKELRVLVQRIQDKFGPAVIDYQEIVGASSIPIDQRLALWKASDVFMCTPIREGLNHWPMEYIYAKDKEKPGVIILSEFTAMCSILNGALRVNPFDIQMTITIIDKALSMEMAEREGRHYRDIDFVSNSPSDKWVRNVLRDLKDAARKQHEPASSANNSSSATPTTPRFSSSVAVAARDELKGTAAFLMRESSASFTHVNLHTLKQAYDNSSRRVIVLDFNGTIVLKEPPGKYLKREILGTSGNKPPPQVIESLALLCADKRNTVYVVSGDSSENLLNAVGHIPDLGLAFSNGAKFSRPTPTGMQRSWQTFDLGVDWDAVKRVALPVLSKYTARSNGSFVKLTTFSIGWSYYSCDPEWGSLQATHLVMELERELKAFDVRFVTLKGVVEVVPRKLNKGLIVKKTLTDIASSSGDGVDFVLCLGDDISDEKMFASVFSYIAEVGDATHATPGPRVVNEDGTFEDNIQPVERTSSSLRDPMYCYTVAVGKKPSHASMYVNDAQEVANALVLLAKGEYPSGGKPAWGREGSTHLFI